METISWLSGKTILIVDLLLISKQTGYFLDFEVLVEKNKQFIDVFFNKIKLLIY